MEGQIKRVYLGLPERLKSTVLWVAREYRTSPLSHQKGGSDIVVEYHSNEVFGYDWIKFPSKYVSAIFYARINIEREEFEVIDKDEQLTKIKAEIKSIYARKLRSMEDHDKEPFEEVWNSVDSKETPWEILEEYDYSPPSLGKTHRMEKRKIHEVSEADILRALGEFTKDIDLSV